MILLLLLHPCGLLAASSISSSSSSSSTWRPLGGFFYIFFFFNLPAFWQFLHFFSGFFSSFITVTCFQSDVFSLSHCFTEASGLRTRVEFTLLVNLVLTRFLLRSQPVSLTVKCPAFVLAIPYRYIRCIRTMTIVSRSSQEGIRK